MQSKKINYNEYTEMDNSPVYRKPKLFGGVITTQTDIDKEREERRKKYGDMPTGGLGPEEINALRKEKNDFEALQLKTQNERLKIQINKTDYENMVLVEKNEELVRENDRITKELIEAKLELANLKAINDKLKNDLSSLETNRKRMCYSTFPSGQGGLIQLLQYESKN